MAPLRSIKEQRDGLHCVIRLVIDADCGCMLGTQHDGEWSMVVLVSSGPHEVLYAVGGYDVWRAHGEDGMHIAATNVSAEEAAQYLIDDYRREKS